MRANGRTTTLLAATAAQIAFQAPRVMEAFKQQGWMHEIFGCSGIRPVESGCHQQTAASFSYHVSTAQIPSHPTSRNGLCPKFMTSKMGGGEKRCRSCSSLKNAACQFVAWTWPVAQGKLCSLPVDAFLSWARCQEREGSACM